MNADSAAELYSELNRIRGAVPSEEGAHLYSPSKNFSQTKELVYPMFISQRVHLADVQEHAIRLTYCSDNVVGVRTKLNFKLNSKLDSLREGLISEYEVGMSWGDEPAGFQFYLSKDCLQGEGLQGLLEIEKELMVLGAGLFTSLLRG